MEDFKLALVNSFSQFLTEKTAQQKENSGGSLLSFTAEINNFDFNNKIDSLLKSSENSFYFCFPEDKNSFIALDVVFSIAENGHGRFASTDKKIKKVTERFINNWDNKNFPLFIGSMKFTVEHSDDVWKDFTDSEWFVPEIIIFNTKSKTHLLFNHYAEQGLSKTRLTEKFRIKVENIFQNQNEKEKKPLPRIINSSGQSPKDRKRWKQIINQILEQLNEKELKKVVIARKIDLILSGEINFTQTINSLVTDYPNCYVFAYHRGKSTFFGATPELLTKISNSGIEVDAIAGSIDRGKTDEEDAHLESMLLSSKKDLDEHRYVLEHLISALKTVGDNITFGETPSVKKLKNIQHLNTKIKADIKSSTSIMNILKELHPTPAVCGFPKDSALNQIKKVENLKRGLYSGIIGWFNLNNEGEFAVSIRSAITSGNKLSAFAGSGIVEGSEPDAEFDETEMKLKPILSLFSKQSIRNEKD
jgi:menaquinone-specific isochorismate synthase